MNFMDTIRKRRSVRAYQSTPLPETAIDKITEAIQLAPTAANKQPFSFLLVTEPETKRKIEAVYSKDWLAQAPAILVAIGDQSQAWQRFDGRSAVEIDTAIAMEHALLAAADEGVASCWICAFATEKMNAALDIEPPRSVVAISPLGYPAEISKEIKHKPAGELLIKI